MKSNKPKYSIRMASLMGLGSLRSIKSRVAQRSANFLDLLSASKTAKAKQHGSSMPGESTILINKPTTEKPYTFDKIAHPETQQENMAEAIKQARLDERKRCAEILAVGIANDSVRTACACAFDTNMLPGAAEQVILTGKLDVDKTTNKRRSLSQRMGDINIPLISPDGGENPAGTPRGYAQHITNVADKVRNGT